MAELEVGWVVSRYSRSIPDLLPDMKMAITYIEHPPPPMITWNHRCRLARQKRQNVFEILASGFSTESDEFRLTLLVVVSY